MMALSIPIPTDAVSEVKGGGYKRVSAHVWQTLLRDGIATLAPDDPCPPWPFAKTPAGYPRVKLQGKDRLVCHLVLEATGRGPRPVGMEACHSCGNGHLGCWHPHHLRWDTHDANLKEAAAKPGGINRGEAHGMAKLTTNQVQAIRSDTRNITQIAKAYGVSRAQVRDIRNRKAWRHV